MDNDVATDMDVSAQEMLQRVLEKDAEREKQLAILRPRGRRRLSVEQRMEQKIRWDGACRLWTGAFSSKEPVIGRYLDAGCWRMVSVRKLLYEEEIGALPADTRFATLPRCGQSRCVTPEHQRFATYQHESKLRLQRDVDAATARRDKCLLRLQKLENLVREKQQRLLDFCLATDS